MLLVFFVGTTPSSNPYDYPFYVISAARVLHGERPYADFAVVYGPLGYYLNAAGLRALQPLPLIQGFNLWFVICTALYLLFFIYQLSFLSRHNKFFVLAMYIYIITLLPIIAHYAYYSLIPVLMLAIAIWCSRSYFATDPLKHKSASGYISLFALAAITVTALLTRINFGVYVCVSIVLVSLLQIFTHKRQHWKQLTILVAIILAFGTLATGILHFNGILLPYIRDMVLFLPRYKARHLPVMYSSSSTEVVLASVLLIIILLVAIDLTKRRLFGCGLMGIIILVCLFHYAYQRFDVEHSYCVFLLLPFVYLAIINDHYTIVFDSHFMGSNHGLKKSINPFNYILSILLALMLLIPLIYSFLSIQIMTTTTSYWLYNYTNDHFFINDGVLILPNETKMLQKLATEDKSEIYWGSMPGCCESTTQVGANLSLYLAQSLLPSSRIWYFDPCSTAYADVQKVLIADLEAKKFKRIGMQGLIDPTIGYLPGNPPESRLFFDYVRSRYTLQNRFTMPEANRYYDIYIRNEINFSPK